MDQRQYKEEMIAWRGEASISLSAIFKHFHRAIIFLISQAPAQKLFLFRLYRFALKKIGRSYPSETYFGATLPWDATDLIRSRIFFFGVWEPDVSRQIERILKPGDVFCDVGANIGYYSLLGSRLVKDQGKVIAIEASPSMFRTLGQSVRKNVASNVRTINVAVSDQRGELPIYFGPSDNKGAASTLPTRGGSQEATVKAAPLDEILTPEEIANLRLIKIDIEGGELPVIRRLVETLHLYPNDMCVIIEASAQDDPRGWQSVFDKFRAAGFNAYAIANQYGADFYLNWKPSPLEPLTACPSDQTDILFTRETRD